MFLKHTSQNLIVLEIFCCITSVNFGVYHYDLQLSISSSNIFLVVPRKKGMLCGLCYAQLHLLRRSLIWFAERASGKVGHVGAGLDLLSRLPDFLPSMPPFLCASLLSAIKSQHKASNTRTNPCVCFSDVVKTSLLSGSSSSNGRTYQIQGGSKVRGPKAVRG